MPKRGQMKKGATKDSVRQRRYNSSPEQKKNRASRNAARAKAAKVGRVHKGDGKDVDHKDSNPRNNSSGNTRVQTKKTNRSLRGSKNGMSKGAKKTAGKRK
tara:strand:+ start:136 stop:438 length:303 start_codon:yes stop_codon:yes gene_type:complete